MPRIKETGTRTRTVWSLSGTGKRSTCDDCGRRELRVGYRCCVSPLGGGFCQRIRCWKCAEANRVEKRSDLGYLPQWLYYAVMSQPICKVCRAEEVLTGTKRGVMSPT